MKKRFNEKGKKGEREKRRAFAKRFFISPSPRLLFSLSLLLTAHCLLPTTTAYSQGWAWQNPLPQGNPLFSVHFAKDKQTGFAVGSDTTILYTKDGGFNWQKQSAPFQTTISGVFVKDKKNAVAVGARGMIFSTDNAGKKMEVPRNKLQRPFL